MRMELYEINNFNEIIKTRPGKRIFGSDSDEVSFSSDHFGST